MKVPINFDLEDAVKNANGILSYKKILINELKLSLVAYGALSGIEGLILGPDGIKWLANAGICIGAAGILFYGVKKQFEVPKFNYHLRGEGYIALKRVALLLNEYIKTDADLLQETEVTKREYKPILEKERIGLQQNKYFLIPTHNGMGKISMSSILQEHEIGTHRYVLSLGTPNKELVLAPSYK